MRCSLDGYEKSVIGTAAMNDDGVFTGTCSSGHVYSIAVQNLPFELLFDEGLAALVDGYLREAVLDFAASLERFCETFVESSLARLQAPSDVMKATWAPMRKASERQYGCFLGLHAAVLHTQWPHIANDTDKRGFRNRVVHEGHWPVQEEVLKYARFVFDAVRTTTDAAQALDADFFRPAISRRLAVAPRPPQGADGSWYSPTTTSFSATLSHNIVPPRTFDDALRDARDRELWCQVEQGLEQTGEK